MAGYFKILKIWKSNMRYGSDQLLKATTGIHAVR